MRYLVIPVAAIPVALLLNGCVAEVAPPHVDVVARPPVVYVPTPPRAVVSVYVEPPLSEPEPIAVGWAPPPLLVESPPPPPFEDAVWVGGYWVWQGDWVWAHGHWVGAPRPNYTWVHPYYEHRDGVVLFITGHWSPPGVAFVPPPPGIHLTVEVAAAGVIAGPRPMGPNGCFVPPPPGSRPGIIIPAPIGTAPAVMTGAPPVVAVGMRVTNNVNNSVHNTTVINNVTNVRNVTNVTNVTIVAPPSATANGQAVNTTAPAQAHLAAAQASVVKASAPEPASSKPVPAFVHGRPPAALPPAQAVNTTASGPKEAHTNTPHPDNQVGGAPMPNRQPATAATQATAAHPGDHHREDKQVAGGPKDNQHPGSAAQHPAADVSKGKPGGASAVTAGQPKQGPGKPADPARHAANAKPPVKVKAVETAAKAKGDHAKKPNGKDDKQEHDKPG